MPERHFEDSVLKRSRWWLKGKVTPPLFPPPSQRSLHELKSVPIQGKVRFSTPDVSHRHVRHIFICNVVHLSLREDWDVQAVRLYCLVQLQPLT